MGGLALGAKFAGFSHKAVVELNKSACETIRQNVNSGRYYTANWPVHEADVRQFSYANLHKTPVLAGGVPCQPFSHAGKKAADIDHRNMFPEFFRAQREIEPKVAIIENVPALASGTFPQYLNYLKLQMQMPGIERRPKEEWQAHMLRLMSADREAVPGTTYTVTHAVLNAADFGVPQWRERLFVVGVRSDLDKTWTPPAPTHSRVALVRDQWISTAYWEAHGLSRPTQVKMGPRLMPLVRRRKELEQTTLPRWRTVRDALSDLPRLGVGETDPADPAHFLNPGARRYQGHAGSRWDEPAKTIKAGAHGVPGGENTVILRNGKLRYFSVREAAVLQGFPKDYHIEGTWISGMRQVGNAVPPPLAKAVFSSIKTIAS